MRRPRRVWLSLAVLLLGAALVLAGIELRDAGSSGGIHANSADAPFGPFAGYLRVGAVASVGASITVPRILRGSPAGQASTWIGAQGFGAPRRFLQIGAIEIRSEAPNGRQRFDGYFTFWSDTHRGYHPALLFKTAPGDVLRTAIAFVRGRWTLTISDARTGASKRISTAQETGAPFQQAEWVQESPGTEGHHAPYPRLSSPRFGELTANGAAVPPPDLYSQWMSVNGINLAPTTPSGGSFSLSPAPAVTAAGARYMRAYAGAGAAFAQFEDERSGWSARTPRATILRATARLVAAQQSGIRVLEAQRWPVPARELLAAQRAHMQQLAAAAQPPAHLTRASFAAWNARLDDLILERAPGDAASRLALGLPAAGPTYRR